MANIPYFNISDLLKAASNDPAYTLPATTTVPEPVQEVKPPPTKTNRCSHTECKRKLMLTDIMCKCDKRYCITHRHPETHSCTFDYKASGIAHLSTILVKANGDRLKERI
jgi:hypothetical protein